MPVVALNEKGLIIDVFGSKPVLMKSEHFISSNNQCVSIYRNNIRFISLKDPKDFTDDEISGYTEMKISKDGLKVAVLCFNKKLVLFNNRKRVFECDSADLYSISDTYFVYYSNGTLNIYNFSTKTVENSFTCDCKEIHSYNSLILTVIGTETSKKLCSIKNGAVHSILEMPNIFRAVIESDKAEKNFIVSLDVEYCKNSYYAESKLYFIKFLDNQKIIDAPADDKIEPKVISSNENFCVYHYKFLRKIHCFKFLENSFFVCFGDQPANLHVYSIENGIFIKNYKKAIRNKVEINRGGDKVINAGFGNLPGNIEVFCNEETTCKFDSLGSSIVKWLNNDSHFIVATTNYFKSDNKITIYDYYGRALEQMDCSNLIALDIFGGAEEPITVEKPAEKNIKKADAKYVPPHLQSKGPKTKETRVNTDKKSIARTKEGVLRDLEEIRVLKERMNAGEELELDDQNKIFSTKVLQEELERFNKSD